MEPSLDQMDDYNRPLKPKKRNTILIAFAVAAVLIFGYALLMSSL